jgi:hypothetical protein
MFSSVQSTVTGGDGGRGETWKVASKGGVASTVRDRWKTSSAVANQTMYCSRAALLSSGNVLLYAVRSRAIAPRVACFSGSRATRLPLSSVETDAPSRSREGRFVPAAVFGQVASPAGSPREFSGMVMFGSGFVASSDTPSVSFAN